MNIEIANRLVQYRKARGMSQEELASELGLSRQAVSKWERAEASPDTDNLIALARLYGVSLDTLLLAEEQPAAQPQAILFDEPAPAAPSLTADELPPYSTTDDPPPGYDHDSNRRRDGLSPGAMMIVKLGGLAVFIVFFFVYGILSWMLPPLKGAYPLICTAVYLILGFIFNQWHPGWLIYLSVPIFYTIFG